MTIVTHNPATGDRIDEHRLHSPAEVRAIIAAAHRAFTSWRAVPFEERATRLRAVAGVLRAEVERLARQMTVEMGKPITAARGEIEKCARVCDYYADNAASMLAEEVVETEASRSFVTFQPLGVILAVMPWNFPYWQVFRFAAPALMAGNAAVLKHASNVPGCAQAIEDAFRAAGFPADLFRALRIDSKAARSVVRHRLVRAATLTGSTAAGRSIAEMAGRMLKKTVLELGGSDAYVVLEDADIDHAAAVCAQSRLINSGQSCIAAKRFIVVEAIRDAFTEKFVEHMRAAVVGDPQDEKTTVGPLARADLRDELHAQVRQSIERGARCLLGGEIPEGPGAFYPPTVLTDVRRGMPAFAEELFGPVGAIIPVRDERAALRTANESAFGLGAAVFTRDRAKGEHIAADTLEAGCCFVNAAVQSDPRMPFGGIKDSGYGRELSHFGIKEFVNIKTVWVQ